MNKPKTKTHKKSSASQKQHNSKTFFTFKPINIHFLCRNFKNLVVVPCTKNNIELHDIPFFCLSRPNLRICLESWLFYLLWNENDKNFCSLCLSVFFLCSMKLDYDLSWYFMKRPWSNDILFTVFLRRFGSWNCSKVLPSTHVNVEHRDILKPMKM